jgi:hypothetical protein
LQEKLDETKIAMDYIIDQLGFNNPFGTQIGQLIGTYFLEEKVLYR